MFFFFKQKTAYEVRISDWSSDVCSSDLQAAAGMGGLVDLDAGAERGDPDRHLPAGADLDVALEPDIGAVDDLVDREGGGRAVRVRLVVAVERLGDALQPALQLDRLALLLAGVQRRERADDAGGALGDYQIGIRDDAQRRTARRDAQGPEQRRPAPAGSPCDRPGDSKRSTRLRTNPAAAGVATG